MRPSAGDRLQSSFEPRRKFSVIQVSPGHGGHDVGQDEILHGQPIPASDHQQFDQVDSRSLVAVHEAVIADYAVDQSRRLLVDVWMVAVIGTGDCRFDGRPAEDARGAAI